MTVLNKCVGIPVTVFYGPPGTGKTNTLKETYIELMSKTTSERIAAITFTREGAKQLLMSARSAYPEKVLADFPYVRTMHSTAFHFLGLTKDQLVTPKDYRDFGARMGMTFTSFYNNESRSADDKYLVFADLVRQNKKEAARMIEELDPFIAKTVCREFAAFKKKRFILDFTDLLQLFILRNEPLPVDYILLDEAQDLSTLQWEFFNVAAQGSKGIYIAGDDDQAIFEWAGADVGAFLSIEGEKKVLGQSYRLPREVLSFAKTITDSIQQRAEKEYKERDEDGVISFVDDIRDVPLEEEGPYLLLVRNRKFVRDVTTQLQKKGYYYEALDVASAQQKDLASIKLWQEGVVYTEDEEAVFASLCVCGVKDIPWGTAWQRAFVGWGRDKIAYMQAYIVRYGFTIPDKAKYKVSTIHTVKGAQADNVVLFTQMSKPTYEAFEEFPDSEHRVFYVGATRAKQRLYVVSPDDEKYVYPVRKLK